MLLLANIVLVISALTGMYCISNYDKRGFIIFFVVELSMGYIGIKTGNYGLTVAAVLYLVMNVVSYIKWQRAEEKRNADL